MANQEQATLPIEIRFALRLANVGYLLAFCVAIAFAPVGYFVFRSPDFALLSIGFGVGYLLCLLCAGFGAAAPVRLAFCIVGSFHYATVIWCGGPYIGLQAFMGCMLAIPMLIYTRKELGLAATSLIIIVSSFILGEFLARFHGPLLLLNTETVKLTYLANMISAGVFTGFLLLTYSRSSIKNYVKLQAERKKSEEALFELVPIAIAEQMIRGEVIVAQSQGECSVLFADIVGFTKLASELSPVHLVEVLNGIFSDIDQLCDKHGVEKIKTIGDCYMAATGVFAGQNRPADLAKVGLGIIEVAQSWAISIGHPLAVRVGISTGQVISGVIGRKRPLFDIWGQTVNIAKLMEANSAGNKVLVSEATLWRLKSQFDFEPFQAVTTKSGDTMKAFQLVAAKAD